MKLVHGKLAQNLAREFCPTILQEWKRIEDFLSPLNFDTPERMKKNLLFGITEPPLYYRISEDEEYYYAFYMVFHAFDWSDSAFSFIRKWDSHLFDTESICFRISKITSVVDVATIFHHQVKVKENSGTTVWIEAEGHGIRPFSHDFVEDQQYTVYPPSCFKLYNFENISLDNFQRIKSILNDGGVDMPDQQAGSGQLFLAPDKFFKDKIGD